MHFCLNSNYPSLNSVDFAGLNTITNESYANQSKGSLDLTGDLDSILLDSNIINNNNTANYFIESMQAIHSLDGNSQATCSDLSSGLASQNMTPGKEQSPMNRINSSSACSSSSASSSSLVNNSMDTFEAPNPSSARFEASVTQMYQVDLKPQFFTSGDQSLNSVPKFKPVKNNMNISSKPKQSRI